VLRYRHFEPPERRQPQVADDYAKWFLARLRTLEPVLAATPFLCAGRFTAADVSVGYALLLAQHLGLSDAFTPAVQAYWGRLQRRQGYQRAMQAQQAAASTQGVPTLPAPDTR
jgi:glutathione S-transferase